MAADEGKFGRIGEVRSCWCPKGIRPTVPATGQTVCLRLCCCSTSIGSNDLILPYANTKMMNLFLHQVSVELADYFIVMQVDKASWHRSKYLKIPENIRLIHQPSYSPQMPVEHIWEEIKENHFYNHVFHL